MSVALASRASVRGVGKEKRRRRGARCQGSIQSAASRWSFVTPYSRIFDRPKPAMFHGLLIEDRVESITDFTSRAFIHDLDHSLVCHAGHNSNR